MIVLCVRSKKLDVGRLELVIHRDYQPIAIASYIKHHAVIGNAKCLGECALTRSGVVQAASTASAYQGRKLSLAGACALAYCSIALLLKIRMNHFVTEMVTSSLASRSSKG